MKNLLIAIVGILFAFSATAQNKRAPKYEKTITSKDLRSYLSVLASDSLEGRETGEPGQKKAAAFIAGKFAEFGLEPGVNVDGEESYFQSYPLNKINYRTAYLKKGDEVKSNFEDFIYYSRAETTGEEFVDVLFVGDASLEDLQALDLDGRYVAITNKDLAGWRTLIAGLKELDAAGVMMFVEAEERYNFIVDRFSSYLARPRMALAKGDGAKPETKILIGNPELASWIFDAEYKDLKKAAGEKVARVIFNADMLPEEVTSENVLGFLEGSEKPDEILVITSHYDHIGVNDDGQINNGADDDGSGTSVVLELAEAFATAAKKGDRPKRSILFMTVSGEEKGLLGSKYYTNNPVYPLENTVTNLNVDMVGRVDAAHEDNPNYVYVIGADKLSQELHDLSEAANKRSVNLELDYTYNDENDPNRYYYRSDHYNFAKNDIPIIFYFNGTHADYHKPTDTIEKIEFDVMTERAKLVFHTAWELANREERVKLND
ncbi:M28 family peptidase [Marinoscillum furvescens]|uniref:Zn-dependent M28 family amino/carboxypeptidase n=1 Tax=Marinoscillum furvescens DSM 4134 TaxID=1122208 RepID=A0A3D9L8A1_MARFU|nr:M28 family peptidase [Marinoscillum furvescens]REE01733.1 Zn-dependent M28 family amino/carboxypeptidase [Marinoscillum furvescens DSM 4134]